MPIDGTDQYSVLIVDDEQKICDLISVFLGLSKHIGLIVSANSAIQAIQKMQNQDFDLIIVDHEMPGKKGVDFIYNLKKSFKYESQKVIIASGALTKQDVLKALNVNIKEILVKPFSRTQLLDKVHEVLGVE